MLPKCGFGESEQPWESNPREKKTCLFITVFSKTAITTLWVFSHFLLPYESLLHQVFIFHSPSDSCTIGEIWIMFSKANTILTWWSFSVWMWLFFIHPSCWDIKYFKYSSTAKRWRDTRNLMKKDPVWPVIMPVLQNHVKKIYQFIDSFSRTVEQL